MSLFEETVPEKLIEVLKTKYETDEIDYLYEEETDEVIAFIIDTDEDAEIQLDILEMGENSINLAVWRGDLFSHEEIIEF